MYRGVICKNHLRERRRKEKHYYEKEKFYKDKEFESQNYNIVSDLDEFDNYLANCFENSMYLDETNGDSKKNKHYSYSCQFNKIINTKNFDCKSYFYKKHCGKLCTYWAKKGTVLCRNHHFIIKDNLCNEKTKCGCMCGFVYGKKKYHNMDICYDCYYKKHNL